MSKIGSGHACSRGRRLLGQLLLTSLALVPIACASVSPSVTCEGIRGLRIGMSKQDVASLLGTPSKILPGPGCGRMLPNGECWSYNADSFFPAGMVFNIEFDSAGLSWAHVYERPVWGDKKPTLFSLSSPTESIETSSFTKYFKCPVGASAR